MRFREALYDGSDPLYAPLTSRSKDILYWKPSARFVKLGANPKPISLTGRIGDDNDAIRAAEARRLTRDLLARFGEVPDRKAGTWAWLIDQYLHGEYSPIRDVKPNTREGYERQLWKWRNAIGHMKVGALDYTQIMRAKEAMQKAGRSDAAIRRMFTMLRIVANHGAALRVDGATDVAITLSNTRFRSSPARKVFWTRDEAVAIIDEADTRGLHSFALGMSLQWWLGLRAVDVRGQWFEADETDGGIIRKTMVKRQTKTYVRVTRWQDGMTWDMVEPDFSGFWKVPSKTARSHPDPLFFNLSDLPEIQSRLRLLAHGGRTGPVILSSDGLPYTREGWTNAFRRIRKHLKLRPELRSMDARAGALTEASRRGASLTDLRDAATHSNTTTTQRYLRGGDEARSRVVKLRRND